MLNVLDYGNSNGHQYVLVILFTNFYSTWENLSRNQFWRHLIGILLVKKSVDLKFVKAIQPLKVRTVWT